MITAHNHPTIRFTDSLGYSTVEPAWIRTRLNIDVFAQHFRGMDLCVKASTWGNPQVLVMPAFNELCGGVAFNESMHDDLLGPVFSSQGLDLDNAGVYLLDGTNLGMLKNIRKLEETRKRKSKGMGNGSGNKRRSKK